MPAFSRGAALDGRSVTAEWLRMRWRLRGAEYRIQILGEFDRAKRRIRGTGVCHRVREDSQARLAIGLPRRERAWIVPKGSDHAKEFSKHAEEFLHPQLAGKTVRI